MSADDASLLRTVALFSLVAWASGLRLYLVVFALFVALVVWTLPKPWRLARALVGRAARPADGRAP